MYLGVGLLGFRVIGIFDRWNMCSEALGRWNNGEWYEERQLGGDFWAGFRV